MTKNLTYAAILTLGFALPAAGGGLGDPIMEPVIIVEDTQSSSSSSGVDMLPRIIFSVLVAVATLG